MKKVERYEGGQTRVAVCCRLLIIMSLTSAFAFGQNKVFTNDDVLKMVKAGFGEETIIEAVRANEPGFDTSADGLLTLKNAGVSEKIITAILIAVRSKKGSTGGISEVDGLPDEIGVYFLKDGRYSDVTVETVDWRSKFFFSTTRSGSVTRSRLAARMNTLESPLHLSGEVEFLVVCPEGVSAAEYHLLRAEPNKDRREFRVDFQVLNEGVLLALGGTGKSAMRFDAERVAAGKFRVKLSSLEKGQYAFLPPGTVTHSGVSSLSKMYTFGVR